MIAAVPRESFPGEHRVALVPDHVSQLAKSKLEVMIEAGAGASAGFPDAAYTKAGAKIAASRKDLFDKADIVLQVRTLGANPDAGKADMAFVRKGQIVIGAGE